MIIVWLIILSILCVFMFFGLIGAYQEIDSLKHKTNLLIKSIVANNLHKDKE